MVSQTGFNSNQTKWLTTTITMSLYVNISFLYINTFNSTNTYDLGLHWNLEYGSVIGGGQGNSKYYSTLDIGQTFTSKYPAVYKILAYMPVQISRTQTTNMIVNTYGGTSISYG